MNRVQTVTQKHYRVEKPGRKTRQVHEHQNWPNWPPRHARCAQAWSYRGRAWPCRGRGPRSYCSSRLPCRSAHPRAPGRRAARSVPRAPTRRVVRVASAPASYRGHSAARQRRVVGVCARSCAHCAARLAAQAHCIVIQLPIRLATLVTIHYVYCDTNGQPSSLPQSQYTRLHCDTNCPQPSLLQYNPAIQLSPLLCDTTQCIAIHFQLSSLFSLSCNRV